jgi:hypothetical protein
MFKYPRRLLPQSDFKIINEFDSYDVLCRYVQYHPVKSEDGKLSALAIDVDHIPTYSTNKIPPSVIDDVLIVFVNRELYKIKWAPGEDPLEIDESDFYYDDSREYFLFRIFNINDFEGTYPIPFTNDKSKFIFKFIVKVIHDPLRVNYSHCVFQIIYFDEKGFQTKKPSQNSLEKVVIASIRDELIKISKFSLEDFN